MLILVPAWCRIFVRILRETSVIPAAQRAFHVTHEMPAFNVRTQLFQKTTCFRITKCNFNMEKWRSTVIYHQFLGTPCSDTPHLWRVVWKLQAGWWAMETGPNLQRGICESKAATGCVGKIVWDRSVDRLIGLGFWKIDRSCDSCLRSIW